VRREREATTATRDGRLSLDADRMTIGKSPATDLPLPDDPTASPSTPSSNAAARSVRRRPGLLHGTWLNAVRVWHPQREVGGGRLADRHPVGVQG
jgi:hypothetical protein